MGINVTEPEHLPHVSTAESEEEIDLAAVHSQLADIEKRIAAAAMMHNQ